MNKSVYVRIYLDIPVSLSLSRSLSFFLCMCTCVCVCVCMCMCVCVNKSVYVCIYLDIPLCLVPPSLWGKRKRGSERETESVYVCIELDMPVCPCLCVHARRECVRARESVCVHRCRRSGVFNVICVHMWRLCLCERVCGFTDVGIVYVRESVYVCIYIDIPVCLCLFVRTCRESVRARE